MTRPPRAPPEIARLTQGQVRDLADELFFWVAHPVARDELRYAFTTLRGATSPGPASAPARPPSPAWPSWWQLE